MMMPVSVTANPLSRFIRMTTIRKTKANKKLKDNQAEKKTHKYTLFSVSFFLYIYISIYLSFFYLPDCLSIYIIICIYMHISVCQSLYQSLSKVYICLKLTSQKHIHKSAQAQYPSTTYLDCSRCRSGCLRTRARRRTWCWSWRGWSTASRSRRSGPPQGQSWECPGTDKQVPNKLL